MIRLRAHHLLCTRGFQGYGYSDEFTRNMAEIVEKLRTKRDELVEIIDEPDDICRSCPNLVDGACKCERTREKPISTYDRKIIEKLNIKPRTILTITELETLVSEYFDTFEKLVSFGLCVNCEWKGGCGYYYELERKGNRGENSRTCE